MQASDWMRWLRHAGHTITYDWTTNAQITMEQAQRDVEGVMTADALVVLAPTPLMYRGTYVELGMAVARGIPIYVVGDGMAECIFTRLPQIQHSARELFDAQ